MREPPHAAERVEAVRRVLDVGARPAVDGVAAIGRRVSRAGHDVPAPQETAVLNERAAGGSGSHSGA